MASDVFFRFAQGAVTAFGDIFRSAIQIELVATQFRVLTGDAETAERALRAVSAFAARTPFTNPSVERAATQLLAFGTTADELTQRLTDLGNIAGVANADIDELATIFGQVNAQGRLTAERFNQLAERGVNLSNELAGELMISVTGVRDAIMQGAVSADIFATAIGNLGDRFQGIDALSMTLSGAISFLGSQFELLRRNIGGAFTDDLTNIINEMGRFLESIQPVVAALSQLVVERVVTFFRDFFDDLRNGRTVFNTLATAIRENQRILVSLIGIYVLYRTSLLAATVLQLAWNAALFVAGPILFLIRNRTILMTRAVAISQAVFSGFARFLSIVWPAAVAIATSPITLIVLALTAVGVAAFALRNRLTLAITAIAQEFVEFGIRTSNLAIAIERVFRSVGATIIEFIAPPLQRVIALLSRVIRAIPSAFRPQFLNNFATSLDNIDLNRFAMGLRTSMSGLVEFRNGLLLTRNELEATGTAIASDLGDQTVFQELTMGLNEFVTRSRQLISDNPITNNIVAGFMNLQQAASDLTPDGIASFVNTGRDFLNSLRETILTGQIPESLTGLLTNIQTQVADRVRQAEDEQARLERNAAEGFDSGRNALVNNEKAKTEIVAKEAMNRARLLEQIMIAEGAKMAILLEQEDIMSIDRRNANTAEEILQLQNANNRIVEIVRLAELDKAALIMNEGMRTVAIERANSNARTSIARNGARARDQIRAAEGRAAMGYQAALSNLIGAGLQAEGVGVRERKALAIAQATINAYAGASRAFVDYPYPASAAVAASVIATGLVQVHNITNTGNFQNGGIVPGNSFSGDRLTANVNSGELILNRAQQSNIAEQIRTGESLERSMDERLARIERVLSQPTTIVNANGQMFAELTRDGIRDGINING